MILSDTEINALAERGMIEPYADALQRTDTKGNRIISYGQSSFGYDIRVADEWATYDLAPEETLYPKKAMYAPLYTTKSQTFIMPPRSFVLCRSVERFVIPDDVMVVVLGKSTYARCGIVVNVTPLEPGWRGYVTIELSNTTPHAVAIHANEGIAQCLFYRGHRPAVTYDDRAGKYQDQPAKIVIPKV